MPRYRFRKDYYYEVFPEDKDIYELDYFNERPKLNKTSGSFFDVKHFFPGWGKCCQDNLDLQAKHLVI